MTTERGESLQQWWDALDDEKRREALDARSAQRLPEWMVNDLARLGGVVGAYFTSTQTGPDAFQMRGDVRDFLDEQEPET